MPDKTNVDGEKGPSKARAYKDLPPAGQVQFADQAGIPLDPNALAPQDAQDKQMAKEAQQAKLQSLKGGGNNAPNQKR